MFASDLCASRSLGSAFIDSSSSFLAPSRSRFSNRSSALYRCFLASDWHPLTIGIASRITSISTRAMAVRIGRFLSQFGEIRMSLQAMARNCQGEGRSAGRMRRKGIIACATGGRGDPCTQYQEKERCGTSSLLELVRGKNGEFVLASRSVGWHWEREMDAFLGDAQQLDLGAGAGESADY